MPKLAKIKVSHNRRKVRISYERRRSPRPSPAWHVTACGRRSIVNGFPTRLYRLDDIATLWQEIGIHKVKTWYELGLLPPAFIYIPNQLGIETPYWIRPQIRALHYVLNEHWRRGHVTYTRAHARTIDALFARADTSVHYFNERAKRFRRKIYRLGIEWIDDPQVSLKRLDKQNKRVVRWDRDTVFAIEE